jgi:hypothetical protein
MFTSHEHAMMKLHGVDVKAAVTPTDECQNCGKRTNTLHHVPEFDYLACDDCMEEAMAILAREQADVKLNTAILAVLTRPMCTSELADLVEEYAGVKGYGSQTEYNFVAICCRLNEWHSMGKVVSELVDGDRIYSLAPERKAPGSVVWGDIKREVA